MITEACKTQLETCCRLGYRNRFNEDLKIDIEEIKKIWEKWDCITVHEGTYASIGLKRFYIADDRINLKDKYHIPFRGTIMPVMEKDIIVIQSILGDKTILRLVGMPEDIKFIKDNIRKDNELNLGMSYNDFVEANRRDLEFHKRIMTNVAHFNKSPEMFDENGEVITSLDHFDNFEYSVIESESHIYNIYDKEKEIRRLTRKVILYEEWLCNDEYKMTKQDIDKAISNVMKLNDYEIKHYFEKKKGDWFFENISKVCRETNLTRGEAWNVWRYLRMVNLTIKIDKLNDRIDELEKN